MVSQPRQPADLERYLAKGRGVLVQPALHNSQPQSSQRVQLLRWLFLRMIAPLAITAAVMHVTRGNYYFDIFGPLAWSLFATHLVATFTFSRTHLLDTGSFFCLIFASSAAANIGERGQLYDARSWIGFAAVFAVYLTLSFVGRRRADRSRATRRSVSTSQVMLAICLLFVAVIVCGASKAGVGFLFVPGLLIIPLVLLWSLFARDPQPTAPDNNCVVLGCRRQGF